ncbi:MAG: hypothetical protein R3F55_09005 [Alphaproteobacteria bacterium]
MRTIAKPGGVALALCLAAGTPACAEPAATPATSAPPLLARLPAGDVAAVEAGIAADLRARLTAILGVETHPGGFALRWDNAVCHEAAPLWTEPPPVGVCFVLAVAVNVGATYAVLVPAEGPAGFALLELVIE